MNNNQSKQIDQIEIHVRTYRSLLKSAGFVDIEKIIDSHNAMKSILHEKGEEKGLDTAAFIYSVLRLPPCMSQVKKIILGQSIRVFKNNKYGEITKWQEVASVGRRRKMFWNGGDKLAVYIASVTDVDDMITLTTAFQIEWNKLHGILKNSKNVIRSFEESMDAEDVTRFRKIWGTEYHKFLTAIKYRKVSFQVKLLSGSYMEYARATQHWWDHIEKSQQDIKFLDRSVYFVSSNTHSLVNLVSRFVVDYRDKLADYLYAENDPNLISIWEKLKKDNVNPGQEYFLYYLAKKLLKTDREFQKLKSEKEEKSGVSTVAARHNLDIDAQIIPVNRLDSSGLGNLIGVDMEKLKKSRSLIINIDYPLGWAAYQVLTEIGQNVGRIRGIYIMGKAAALNGQIGDILLPSTVYDAHTKNTYALTNCFSIADFKKIFKSGIVLENQKTVTTKGTFLESPQMIENWFREGTTDIEMEAGPFLNAVYEFIFYNRYEENEFISVSPSPFELGIAHYASDTPYSKAKNLGTRTLSYDGVESTYAISQVILTKIVQKEISLLT